MLYIHEQTEIVAGKVDGFVDLFEGVYQPLMEGLGARLVGLWETVAISLPWPQAIALWELDDMAHYARVANGQYRSRELTPKFRDWRQQLASVRFQLPQIEALYRFGPGYRARGLNPQDLSRVHNVVRVDRLLDRAHDAYRLTMLGN